MAQGHTTQQRYQASRQKLKAASLSAVCVGDEDHHWGPGTHPRMILQIAKTLGIWGGVVCECLYSTIILRIKIHGILGVPYFLCGGQESLKVSSATDFKLES